MSKKTNTLEDLWKELDKPETIWYKLSCIPYRVRDFVKDLYYNLHPHKLRHLMWFIKFWWKYWNWDFHYGLILLQYSTDDLITKYKDTDIYVGQNKDLKDIKIFKECLDRHIKDDFIDKKEYTRNLEMMTKYLQKCGKWWI